MREPGEPADSMEMQPIVSPRPGAADPDVLFQYGRVDASPPEGGRCGKSRGATADDHDG